MLSNEVLHNDKILAFLHKTCDFKVILVPDDKKDQHSCAHIIELIKFIAKKNIQARQVSHFMFLPQLVVNKFNDTRVIQ